MRKHLDQWAARRLMDRLMEGCGPEKTFVEFGAEIWLWGVMGETAMVKSLLQTDLEKDWPIS